MLAKGQTGRAAAGKRQALHLEKRYDVLIEPRIVLELLDQIEKNIRRERFQFLPQKIDIVENREMLGAVTEAAERFHHVGFRFPVFGLHLGREILVDRGRSAAVEKNENFEFLFHCLFGALELDR